MKTLNRFYIDGRWVEPSERGKMMDIVSPSLETTIGQLTLGSAHDADHAVAAARAAFPAWSESSCETRIALLERIAVCYRERLGELAHAVCEEIGAPATLCKTLQAPIGLAHLQATIDTLRHFEFESTRGKSVVRREAIGVAALITPWNWPLNQIVAKVAPALAAGCTVVLKPSELAPLDAMIFAEIMHDAGTPAGVFNMIFGEGREVGARLSSHPQVDMVSITGSTRAGVEVAISAAPTVKRVAQELGGKSANILLDDVDLEEAVKRGVAACFVNSGQSCSIPTRMLVPRHLMNDAAQIAKRAAELYRVGPTDDASTQLGPLVNRNQFERVQTLIQTGIDEGARLVTGGPGLPDGIDKGYYAKPTVFADVTPDMTIAREEIFGPVLSMIPYDSEADAIAIANGTDYGLAAYVQSADIARARKVGRALRAGGVHLNYPPADFHAPFGGYKRSGNGREWGEAGLREYLETKAMVGYGT